MTLSDRLRKVYRSNCNSMEEFANRIGVSKSSVEKWIQQGAIPRLDKLKKISEEFQVDLIWLQTGISNDREREIPSKKSKSCAEKDKEILLLKARLKDKEEIIQSLRDQVQLYKEKLGEDFGLSKQA